MAACVLANMLAILADQFPGTILTTGATGSNIFALHTVREALISESVLAVCIKPIHWRTSTLGWSIRVSSGRCHCMRRCQVKVEGAFWPCSERIHVTPTVRDGGPACRIAVSIRRVVVDEAFEVIKDMLLGVATQKAVLDDI